MDEAHRLIDKTKESLTATIELPKFDLLSHDELINLNIPPMKWIINMVIPHPGLVVLSGKPGSYKTFFALWLGLRASSGLPLFDSEECEQPFFCSTISDLPMGKVPTLMIEEENSKQLMKERARGFRPIEIGGLYYLINNGFKFKNDEQRIALRNIIEQKQIKLLILDPFSSVMGLSDENSNSEVAEIIDVVRKEFVEQDVTVVLLHHPSKGDGSGKNIRGASDILGKCDVHLCMEADDKNIGEIKVTYEKLRVADRGKVKNFRIRLTGDSDLRDHRFRYLGEAKSKTEEDREELAKQILKVMEDGEERKQKEIADLVEQKAANDKFKGAWKKLIAEKKLLVSATSKKYHIDHSTMNTIPF